MLKSMYVEIQEALIDLQKLPWICPTYHTISGNNLDPCQEKAENPT